MIGGIIENYPIRVHNERTTVGGRNEYSLDHHNWVCGGGDSETALSWKCFILEISMSPLGIS